MLMSTVSNVTCNDRNELYTNPMNKLDPPQLSKFSLFSSPSLPESLVSMAESSSSSSSASSFKQETSNVYDLLSKKSSIVDFSLLNDPYQRNYLTSAYVDEQVSIKSLQQQIYNMNREHEKKLYDLQTALTNKEIELKECRYQLSSVQQLCNSQAAKLNDLYLEINMYQQFIQLKGGDLLNTEYAAAKDRKYPEPYHTMEFDRNHYEKMSSLDLQCIQWDVLVERIVLESDQQVSLFMQQKFKSASLDQKQEMFTAVHYQAFPLMINRFGNFLVQRLFELGTPEQVQSLAKEMEGRVLELACHPFGCHVLQKALEHVKETTRTELVSELSTDTLLHKHACHVWQKIFEMRWVYPVMNKIHASLKNQWSQIALNEIGSLVIQNIFENLSEQDKRPILNEVLSNVALISKGQWGNWVIQHILEQAEKTTDREFVFDFIIQEATQLSIDQHASKVVEKALRLGGALFMTRFIQRICSTTLSHKPRIALVDMASDQYGNYVVQWLIQHANDEQKIHICRLMKRHMVSIRGSKYGQRVALLVEKVLRQQDIIRT